MDRNVPTVILVLAVLSYTRGQCPRPSGNQFIYSNATNKCYLAKSLQYSYDNARRYCRDLVFDESFRIADLVSLDTKDSYLAVREIVNAQTNPPFDYTWIGLRAQYTDWKWAPKTDNPYIEPQGCYDDIYGLGELISRDQPVETFEGCLRYCRNNVYKYAGRYLETSDVYRCRCSNTWNNNGMIVKDCNQQLNRMWVYRLQDSTDANLFHSGEPDNYDGYARCLGLASWPERGWDDTNCGERLDRSHICQFPLDTVECENLDYYYFSSNDFGVCLMPYRDSRLNWYGARADCTKKGGDLLVDDREDLHAFLKTTAEIAGETGTKTVWWLGGTSVKYTWENGEPLKNYERWDRSEPRNPGNLCARIHVHAGADASGDAGHRWQDQSCDNINTFVCETSLLPTTPAPPTTTPTPATTPTTPTTQAPTPTPVTATPVTPAPTPATPAPTPATPAPTPATPAPPAPTPATPAPTPATPTPATPAPTPATPAPGPNTPPTGFPTSPPAPEDSTAGAVTPTGDSAPSTGEDEDIIFTNGVIVAIVIAGVAVLVATIRLFVYCCQRRNGPRATAYKSNNPGFGYDTMPKPSPSPMDKPLEDVQVTNDTYASVKRPNSNETPAIDEQFSY